MSFFGRAAALAAARRANSGGGGPVEGLLPLPSLQTAAMHGDNGNDANNFVNTNQTFDLGTGDATWEFWHRTPNTGKLQRIVDGRGTGALGAVKGWQMSFGFSGVTDYWGNTLIDDGAGQHVKFSTTAHGTRDNKWHHAAVTWQNSTGKISLYIDGVFKESQTNASLIGTNFSTGNSVSLLNSLNDQAQGWDGDICEVRLWNKIRTVSQIKENMWRSLNPDEFPDLKHYWRGNGDSMDEVTSVSGSDGTDVTYPTNFTPFRSSNIYEQYMHEVLTPTVYWPLEDASTAVNVMQTGTAAAFNVARAGTPAANVNGLLGVVDATVEKAWDLNADGNGIVVSVTNAPTGTSPDDWTVAAWIQDDDIAATRYVYATGQSISSINDGILCGVSSTGHPFMDTDQPAEGAALQTALTLVPGRTYFVVWVHNSTTGDRAIYVNGVLEASDTGAAAFSLAANQHWCIGRKAGSDGGGLWNGRIHHLAGWATTCLTADDVMTMYLIGAAGRYRDIVLSDAPSFYYRLSEPSGTTVVDEKAVHDGTYTSGPVVDQGPLLNYGQGAMESLPERDEGSSVLFDGVNDWANVGNAGAGPESLMEGTQSVTFEGWCKTTSTTAGIRAWGGGQSTDASPLFDLVFNQGTGGDDPDIISIFRRAVDDTSDQADFNSGGLHHDGNPHHYVLTYDGTNAKLYFDGVLVITLATTKSLGASLNEFAIGALRRGGATLLFFPGTISEWAAYNYALPAERVRAHYLAGKAFNKYGAGVGASGPVSYWKLNELTGTNAADELGQNDGTYTNSPGLNQTALTSRTLDDGKAVVFDSTNYVAVVGGISSLFDGVAPHAIEFTCKTLDSTQGVVPVSPGDAGGNACLWSIQFNQTHSGSTPVNNPNFIELVRRNAASTLNTANVNLAGEHRDGSRHRYRITYDGSNGLVFFDGVQKINLATTLSLTSMDRFSIGGLLRAGFTFGVIGTFDDVILWDFIPATPYFTANQYFAR